MDVVNSVPFQPQDDPRGVAVLDSGDPDEITIIDGLTAAELAVVSERNAAVAFWLPKDAHATVHVMRKDDGEGTVSWEFNYLVCDAAGIYDADRPIEELAINVSDPDPTKGRWFVKWCHGKLLRKYCDNGLSPTCELDEDDNPYLQCVPTLK